MSEINLIEVVCGAVNAINGALAPVPTVLDMLRREEALNDQVEYELGAIDAVRGRSKMPSSDVSIARKLLAMTHALDVAPNCTALRDAVARAVPDLTEHIESATRLLAPGGETLSMPAGGKTLNSLLRAVQTEHRTLAARELSGTTQVLRTALKDVGYGTLDEQHRGGRTLVRGRADDTALIVELRDDGRFTVDAAGFREGHCHEAVDQLLTRLTALGLPVRRQSTDRHGRLDGGELAREAGEVFRPLQATALSTKTRARAKTRG